MIEPILTARVEPADDGTVRVLAPRVGYWSLHPHPGALVGPGSRIGTIERLGNRFALVLPENAAGRVASVLPKDRVVPVEYGALLFTLAPLVAEDRYGIEGEALAVGVHGEEPLPPGCLAVVAPTDGIYYRSPSPGARPFVEAGARVVAGQPVGLVEVMKTFNQILFGGPGFPEEADVLEVRAADREEVRAGQTLLVVRLLP